MGPTTLLLIDDHPLFRRGLAEYFNSTGEFQVVGEASSGRQGIALAEQLRPGLILIDLHMPGLGGLHVLDELGQLEIESRKVVLTASLDRNELLTALRLGADGYMLKETEPEDLRLYIRNCVQGVIVLDDCLVTLLAKDDDVPEGERGTRQVELTEREAQTLALISEGMSNKQIARQLGISDGTVKVYVKNLLRKLNLRSRLELAAWVHRDALARQ
ncbi:response regulator [Paraburkholderia sp. IMGN_8]|jgi:two-component system nitrate/nitrite response regulator NarL|uniref:response regulator n=1 Tax=unclassified Paraburkholderia TaxID=2615204 RepID=UPI0031012569